MEKKEANADEIANFEGQKTQKKVQFLHFKMFYFQVLGFIRGKESPGRSYRKHRR